MDIINSPGSGSQSKPGKAGFFTPACDFFCIFLLAVLCLMYSLLINLRRGAFCLMKCTLLLYVTEVKGLKTHLTMSLQPFQARSYDTAV